MTSEDVLAQLAFPGTFRARQIRSTQVADWLKPAIVASMAVPMSAKRGCPELMAGPQTIVQWVETPDRLRCMACHGRHAEERACAVCGAAMTRDLTVWQLLDAEIPVSGLPPIRFSGARCPDCRRSADDLPVR
ncbi:hypothetical protein OV450_1325 [Actinobacteria bacterium OV450]|nr:hypothetical protein OV450_1325 [Actinobacteria bacterium OV450]